MSEESLNATETNNFRLLRKLFGRVALLRLTARGLQKQDPDATAEFRALLRVSGLHDYEKQKQGKEYINTTLADYIDKEGVTKTSITFNRAPSRKTHRRYRIHNAKEFIKGDTALGVFVVDGHLLLVNISEQDLRTGSAGRSPSKLKAVNQLSSVHRSIPRELLKKIRVIARQGWHENVVKEGSSAVGETLERRIGIKANASKRSDYRGIELKSSASLAKDPWYTLFTNVPEWSLSTYRNADVIKATGSKNYEVYESKERPNGMRLKWNSKKLVVTQDGKTVLAWQEDELKYRLLEKHSETFWVSAKSRKNGAKSEFQYESIAHTKNPSWAKFRKLVKDGKVALHIRLKHAGKSNAVVRDYAFRIPTSDLFQVFEGKPRNYKLR